MNLEKIKPGLYWCKANEDAEKWDCIAIVGGERPFLNVSIFSIFFERMLDEHTETSIVWGPRIEPPGQVEEQKIDICQVCKKEIEIGTLFVATGIGIVHEKCWGVKDD